MSVGNTWALGAKYFLRFASRLLTVIFVSSLLLAGWSAEEKSPRESKLAAQVRTLNNSMLQLHTQLQQNASNPDVVRGQATSVLTQRATALQALIQENPHAALTLSFSAELLADLAAKFPNSASQLESHVTLTGSAERWVADDIKNPAASTESWFLVVNGARLALYFATPQRPNIANITVTGVQAGSRLAVAKITAGPQAMTVPLLDGSLIGGLRVALVAALLVVVFGWLRSRVRLRQFAVVSATLAMLLGNPLPGLAQSCSTTGAQETAVLLVSFEDLPVAMTASDAYNVMFDTSTGHSVSGFWQDASHGQTSASGSVFGPITIGQSTSYTCSDIAQVFYDAAAASGLDLANYNRIFVFMPGINCTWGGFTISGAGNAGCTQWTTSGGTLTASVSFVIDSILGAYGRDAAVQTSSHEAGHQLMLGHAGTETDEPTAVLGPSATPGTRTEFNDFFSVMGEGVGYTALSTYNAQHQVEELGWLAPNTNWQTVTGNGTYTLAPLETSTGGLQALRVARGAGNTSEYLWIEYRQPIGYDATNYFMNFNGALIHYAPILPSYDTRFTSVVDFTPSDVGRWFNTVLAPGQSWTDAYSNVSISVLSASSAGLSLSVSYGATPCTSSAPTVGASPLNPSIYASQTANYSVSLTNNDSSACSPRTFTMTSSEPSGWSTSFSSSSVSVGPGQSASITLSKGAPPGTPAGTYAVNVTAADSISTATDTANATVVTAPSLAITVSILGTSFLPPGSVPISAFVASGGSPVSGASVSFTVTAPNGSTTTQTATTGSNGAAAWSYKLSTKSALGTYSVVARSSLSSGSSGGKKTAAAAQTAAVSSNTATFSVK